MQRKHGAGDALDSLSLKVFESWFSGGDAQEQQCDHRGMGKPRPGQWWPHNQETRAGYWEPSKAGEEEAVRQ